MKEQSSGMRVVVTGATGTVGTSVIEALAVEPQVSKIVGLARRLPDLEKPKVRWVHADVASAELAPHFYGADAVVHLAWAIQPSHDEKGLPATPLDPHAGGPGRLGEFLTGVGQRR